MDLGVKRNIMRKQGRKTVLAPKKQNIRSPELPGILRGPKAWARDPRPLPETALG